MRKWERDFKEQFRNERKRNLDYVLAWLFGTPDAPRLSELADAGVNAALDPDKIAMAAGPVGSDEQGRPRGVYREYCAHCHGVSGDGAGPMSTFLSPYPRDFRRGIYKFKSTPKGQKPTHADLRRILVDGIPGTAMPSYRAIPEEEIESLVHYVRYLSIRGEVERILIEYAATELDDEEPLMDEEAGPEEQQRQAERVRALAARSIENWKRADSLAADVPTPDPNRDTAESLVRGRELFLGDVAGCVKCHGATGRGDGQTTDYDDWTKEMEPTNAEALAAYREVGLLAPRTIRPRNFRLGIFRGGSSDRDLFLRIRYGIDGTPMPEALVVRDENPDKSRGLTTRDIWCLVDFVRSLRDGSPVQPATLAPGEATQRR